MKKLSIFLLLFLLPVGSLFSANDNLWYDKDINSLSEDEVKTLPKPMQRFIHFERERAYPFDEIPDGAWQKANNQLNSMMHTKNKSDMALAQQPEWTCIGPYNIGGRVKSIVVHPNDPDIVYIGAAAGGVWKTTDGGSTWTPLFDKENAISFGALAIDPNNPDIVYAGTGESVMGNNNIYLGSGMYKTTDAGATWNLIGLANVGAFSKVYVHPKNSNLIIAGATSRNAGIYKSTDAGATWEKKWTGTVTDVTINESDENKFYFGQYGDGIFYTEDGGDNWLELNVGISFEEAAGRFSVQMAQSNPDVLYTLFEANVGTAADDKGHARIYKTTNGGVSWKMVYKGFYDFFNGQGFYDNYIAVNPNDEETVYAGGIDIHRASKGTTYNNITHGYSGGDVHVDQQCFAFYKQDPDIIYVGNDGGVYKSVNGGNSFIDCNAGLSITQFYALGVDDRLENRVYGGTQDNGTLGNFISGLQWGLVFGGDGFKVIVDRDDPNYVYGETPNGGLWKRNLQTGYAYSMMEGISATDAAIWDAPLVNDPNYSDVFYHGRHHVYVSFDKGGSWYLLESTYKSDAQYTAIDVAIGNELLIYAGTNKGEMMVSRDGGVEWEDVSSNGLVNRFITDIETSPHDPKTAYATFSGFGAQNVFKTTDEGNSWFNIGSKLPDIPCNAIAVHPYKKNHLFVATDIGVFASFNEGETWFPYGRNLPRSPVKDITFRQNVTDFPELMLRVATHGRSMWEIEVIDEDITEPEITSPAGGEIFISGTSQRISWHGFDLPVDIYLSTDDGETWDLIKGNVESESMLWVVHDKPSFLARVKVVSRNSDKEKISNTFTIEKKEIGSILQLSGVTFVPYGIAWDGDHGLYTTSFYANKLFKLNSETFVIERIIDLPGDSLFTDLTFDREKRIIYMHRMETTDGGGGKVIVIDTNGTKLDEFKTPGIYPIGIELIDGKLLLGDRDGKQMLSWYNLETNEIEEELKNPYSLKYGPRGITYDKNKYVYQVCTYFPTQGQALTEALIIRMDKNNVAEEVSRMPLENMTGIINARGIEYDHRDKNYWLTDFGGNLYKIAGFDTQVSVEDDPTALEIANGFEAQIYPNPLKEFATISFNSQNMRGNLKIEVVNMLGEIVGTFFDKTIESGNPNYVQLSGDDFANGIYSVVFTLNGAQVMSKKLIVVK